MSPYEIRLHSEDFRRIGLISTVRPGCETAIITATTPPDEATRTRWADLGLRNVSVHLQETPDATFVFLFAEYAGTDPLQAAELVQKDPWFEQLHGLLTAHPRTATHLDWFPMELINIIGPTLPHPTAPRTTQRSGLISALEPASELQYRTLHQTNWPGVVDQMARCNRRYWVTFLIELGEKLWLFTYSEYVGEDYEADDAATAADPVTNRWWKFTEPCLIPLREDGKTWTQMVPLFEVTPATPQEA